MLTSKQRSNLKSLSNKIDPSVTIGKGGLTENVIKELNDALEAHELIKIQVLNNCEFSAKDALNDLAKQLRAEPVQALGSRMIIYRKSHKDGIKHIEF